jgi:hypothetical protein
MKLAQVAVGTLGVHLADIMLYYLLLIVFKIHMCVRPVRRAVWQCLFKVWDCRYTGV